MGSYSLDPRATDAYGLVEVVVVVVVEVVLVAMHARMVAIGPTPILN